MVDFTTESFLASQMLKDFPSYVRSVARYFITAVSKIFEHFALARKLIGPITDDRERNGERSDDLLQGMMDNVEGRSKSVLSAINLHIAFKAIHTSPMAVTHGINDLCVMPKYVETLNQEVERDPAEGEGPSKKAFLKMPKLDSFMKGNQRLIPLLLSQPQHPKHQTA